MGIMEKGETKPDPSIADTYTYFFFLIISFLKTFDCIAYTVLYLLCLINEIL